MEKIIVFISIENMNIRVEYLLIEWKSNAYKMIFNLFAKMLRQNVIAIVYMEF